MKPLTILSLGAGVQSTCLALMAARGEVEKVDAAIFADTMWEPRDVYEHLDWLEEELPYPVHRVSHGDLRKDVLLSAREGKRVATPPFFTDQGDGVGLLMRQCTKEYKIDPIYRKVRELLGLKKGQRVPEGVKVRNFMGISLDEIQRMKESPHKWMENIFPLVEKRMSRHDCLRWLEKSGYPRPPRSACVGCPYHSLKEWRSIREDPDEWDDVVKFDREIRGGLKGTKSALYLHRSLKPLDEVDLSTDVEQGQLTFLDECDGMCGN